MEYLHRSGDAPVPLDIRLETLEVELQLGAESKKRLLFLLPVARTIPPRLEGEGDQDPEDQNGDLS
jgi:hypothetical protein